jgi:hypothetical protein
MSLNGCFRRFALAAPTRDGLAGNLIFRVLEDSRGDIWISSTDGKGGNGLSRWQRSTGSLRHFSREPGFGDDAPPTKFREDHTGALLVIDALDLLPPLDSHQRKPSTSIRSLPLLSNLAYASQRSSGDTAKPR